MNNENKYLKYKKKYLDLVNTLKDLDIYDQVGGLDIAELQKKKNELKKIYKDDPMWYDKNKPIPIPPPLPKKEEKEEKKENDKVRYILRPYVYIPPYRKKIYYDFNNYYDEDSEDEYEYKRVRKSAKRKSAKRKSAKRKSAKRKSTKRKSTKRKSAKRKSTKRKSTKRKSTKRKSSRK
jgi:hypothetical protein